MIRREVGPSARGTFYVARRIGQRRPVMLELIAADAGMRAQLKHEVRAASTVPHRGIIDVLDRDECAHGPFVVTEFVRGESLHRRLARRELSAEEIGAFFHQVVDQVAACHKLTLVHGGIGVRQVVLEKTAAGVERARLLDFGIVRKADKLFGSFAATEPQELELSKQRTALMARGVNVDILALGHLLSAMLPRRMPRSRFAREHEFLRIARVSKQEVPGKQYRNCDELMRQLQLAREKIAPPLKPARWHYYAFAGLLVLAFMLSVGRAWFQRNYVARAPVAIAP